MRAAARLVTLFYLFNYVPNGVPRGFLGCARLVAAICRPECGHCRSIAGFGEQCTLPEDVLEFAGRKRVRRKLMVALEIVAFNPAENRAVPDFG